MTETEDAALLDVLRDIYPDLHANPELSYEGHWGQVGPRAFYTGPTGPNMKQFWTKPFTWSE